MSLIDAQQTRKRNHNVVLCCDFAKLGKKCGSNVATTKSTTLHCDVLTIFQNNVVAMLYMKLGIHIVATMLWYSRKCNFRWVITVCRENKFFILLQ